MWGAVHGKGFNPAYKSESKPPGWSESMSRTLPFRDWKDKIMYWSARVTTPNYMKGPLVMDELSGHAYEIIKDFVKRNGNSPKCLMREDGLEIVIALLEEVWPPEDDKIMLQYLDDYFNVRFLHGEQMDTFFSRYEMIYRKAETTSGLHINFPGHVYYMIKHLQLSGEDLINILWPFDGKFPESWEGWKRFKKEVFKYMKLKKPWMFARDHVANDHKKIFKADEREQDPQSREVPIKTFTVDGQHLSDNLVTRIGQIRHELYLLEQHPTYLAQTHTAPPQNLHAVKTYHTDVSRCPDDLCLTVEDDDDTSVNDFSDVSSMTGEGDICESRDINDDERYDAEHAYMQFRKWRRRVKRYPTKWSQERFQEIQQTRKLLLKVSRTILTWTHSWQERFSQKLCCRHKVQEARQEPHWPRRQTHALLHLWR